MTAGAPEYVGLPKVGALVLMHVDCQFARVIGHTLSPTGMPVAVVDYLFWPRVFWCSAETLVDLSPEQCGRIYELSRLSPFGSRA
jgi:hypothetical protein